MWDFSQYALEDLFKIRDAEDVLSHYEMHDSDMLFTINLELQEREKKGLE